MNNKALVSIIELAFVFLLFSGSLIYFNAHKSNIQKDYKFTVDSALDSLYYNTSDRAVIFNENLSVSTVTANWSNYTTYLNSIFSNYELIVSNNTISKTIVNCSSSNEKYFAERIIAIKNNTDFQFRKIRLGVCY